MKSTGLPENLAKLGLNKSSLAAKPSSNKNFSISVSEVFKKLKKTFINEIISSILQNNDNDLPIIKNTLLKALKLSQTSLTDKDNSCFQNARCYEGVDNSLLQQLLLASKESFEKILLADNDPNTLGNNLIFQTNAGYFKIDDQFSTYMKLFTIIIYPNGGKYVGEYRNGKMHGLGAYLYHDGAKYIGDWKNDIKNGRGTEISTDGTQYTGSWSNGVRHGKGTCRFTNKEIYEGEWKNDKRDGRSIETYPGGAKYIGNWCNDVRIGKAESSSREAVYKCSRKDRKNKYSSFDTYKYNDQDTSTIEDGHGRKIYPDKGEYVGDWSNKLKHGKGIYTYADGSTYEGEWKNDLKDGYGTKICANGEKYVGEWKNDLEYGYGEKTYIDKAVYIGEWSNGVKHGKGLYTYPDGSVYDGEWQNGMEDGLGKRSYVNGDEYIGNWYNGVKYGKGIYTCPDGSIYDGEWKNGMKNGHGKKIYEDGEEYDGEWSTDIKSGRGIYAYPNGATYIGRWENDMRNGEGTYTSSDGTVYHGKWKDDDLIGEVLIKSSYGDTYRGGYKDGTVCGIGTWTCCNGAQYHGQWNGLGVYQFLDGTKYEGLWENDEDLGIKVKIIEDYFNGSITQIKLFEYFRELMTLTSNPIPQTLNEYYYYYKKYMERSCKIENIKNNSLEQKGNGWEWSLLPGYIFPKGTHCLVVDKDIIPIPYFLKCMATAISSLMQGENNNSYANPNVNPYTGIRIISKGTYTYPNGNIYEGELFHNKPL